MISREKKATSFSKKTTTRTGCGNNFFHAGMFRGNYASSAADSPTAHRGRGGRTAATREFAIDHDHIQVLPREALGNQRSGNTAADDQRIACHVLGDVEADSRLGCGKPGRAAAAQIGLLGIV
jgi:hypothetical protein